MITAHKVEAGIHDLYKLTRGSRQTPQQPQPKTPSIDYTVAKDKLLEEMAMYFTALEAIDVWPEDVFFHCEAWAALMGLHLRGGA